MTKPNRLPKRRNLTRYSVLRNPFCPMRSHRIGWYPRLHRYPARPIPSSSDPVFLEYYREELEMLQTKSHPLKEFSYQHVRIGGQCILPRVQNQGAQPICGFMSITSCVEARYRLLLARAQEENQILLQFEPLTSQSWVPQGLVRVRKELTSAILQSIRQLGIAVEREYFHDPLMARRYRVVDSKSHILWRYGRCFVIMEQSADDWATLMTTLMQHGPFVATFTLPKPWLGKVPYVGLQNVDPHAISHSVLVTGFKRDATGRYFEIMNSWGSEWGYNGFGWVNMECLEWILMPHVVLDATDLRWNS